MAPRLKFGILGPLEVRRGGRLLGLPGPKQRALLAILLLHANEVISTDQLVDRLWAGEPPTTATKVVQVYISQLRKLLEPDAGKDEHRVLITRPPGYMLTLARGELDLHRFEDLLILAREALSDGIPAIAADRLRDALELWRGEPLADFRFERFAQIEIARLEELRLSALEDLFQASLALGRHAEVIGNLEALLSERPTRERLGCQLMLALYRSGRQAEALDVYARVRGALVEQLGIEPAPELGDLQQRILTQDDSLRWVPPRSHPSPNNLPVQVTSFVARAVETAKVEELLAGARLVTLIGPGGCGKTRLAVEVAVRALPRHPRGVWLVELASIHDGSLVPTMVSAALGLKEEPGRDLVDTIINSIGDRSMLVLLDNCEHVIEGCAVCAEALLRGCPNLRTLATSREALAIAGEVSWEVPSLPVPAGDEAAERLVDNGAIRLFVDRARSSYPAFRPGDQDLSSVVRICRGLDGMPLAIELVAPWVRTMSVDQIAERLDHRLRFLVSGSRTAPPRHKTLRGVMDWSYHLLSAGEARLFAHLSVFAGGFALPAARAVCGHVAGSDEDFADTLSDLVAKSLVAFEHREGEGRYRLLETIREYAAEKLVAAHESDEAGARHAVYFLDLAQQAEPHLRGSGQRAWLEGLDGEIGNLRAALGWFVRRGDGERQMRLATALWRYCYLRGRYSEGRGWLQRALEHIGASPRRRADALTAVGALAFYLCDYEPAETDCRAALELYRAIGDERGTASALTFLGGIARERADYDRCLSLHSEALTIFRALGDEWGAAHCLQMSGFASWLRGDLDGAAVSGEALRVFRELHDGERAAWALMDLAVVAHYRGDQPTAARLLADSLSAFEELGFKEGIAWSLHLLALVDLACGDQASALRRLHGALELHRDLGDRWRICSIWEALAAAGSRTGMPDVAAAFLGAAESLRGAIGAPIPPCERPARELTAQRLSAQLGDETFESQRTRGRAMSLDEACDLALGPELESRVAGTAAQQPRAPQHISGTR